MLALGQDRLSSFTIGIHVRLLRSAPSNDLLVVGLPVSKDDGLDATAYVIEDLAARLPDVGTAARVELHLYVTPPGVGHQTLFFSVSTSPSSSPGHRPAANRVDTALITTTHIPSTVRRTRTTSAGSVENSWCCRTSSAVVRDLLGPAAVVYADVRVCKTNQPSDL
ncbi:uncharacterized protein LOC110435079 isoform X2 [Sorghum bicolor]|uniref:uncharacterized protein LOC110435079 isoform X2 n=1 Tax=Sorghum bicolor TaxID=4558 RepID=UPI0007F1AF4F|nr:uncharacterized protein LOC110435079 isoform X2 [Sorghum bicolor]|eukprot:XP_021316106.1 uncharacterized protein LOC110435079 isoform X2 [Sorghum bicolor]